MVCNCWHSYSNYIYESIECYNQNLHINDPNAHCSLTMDLVNHSNGLTKKY